MKRKLMSSLLSWLESADCKPLILRGARQTGKTYLVRDMAVQVGKTLVEINFEQEPEAADLFESNDPKTIIYQIEIYYGIDIDINDSILFLDEIQACPFLLSKLRWFYEKLPGFPVICAGSLLEFALDDYEDSMPVGRVTYRYLHPFSFVEFLWAIGEDKSADNLHQVRKSLQMPDALHNKYIELYRQYCVIGGMPAVVKEWAATQRLNECLHIQKDLINSFRDDFNKYRKKIPSELLRKSMDSAVYQAGNKFVFSKVDRSSKQPAIKTAVEMLEKAGICKKVYHSAGNGIPLGAEKNEKFFKLLFLDTGLYMATLGLSPLNTKQLQEISWSNSGALAELVCGQLLTSVHSEDNDDMFYWQNTGSGNGEIDYLIQSSGQILPIEVKSGASGSMKSLHSFMESKKLKKAVRFDLNKPSVQEINVLTTLGKNAQYRLLSLPVYMAEFTESQAEDDFFHPAVVENNK